jgi:hypothetical protein
LVLAGLAAGRAAGVFQASVLQLKLLPLVGWELQGGHFTTACTIYRDGARHHRHLNARVGALLLLK